jgi:hypothetical protein
MTARRPGEHHNEFAGRLIACSSFDDWSERIGQQILGGYLLREAEPSVYRPPDCSVHLHRHEGGPLVPAGLRRFEMDEGCWRASSSAVYFEVEGAVIRDPAPRDAPVEVWLPEEIRSRGAAVVAVVALAIQAALRRCGLFNLHAAGLVRPVDQAGFLIIGGPGAGKSTLALRLAGQGWGYLSDDMLALELSERSVQAHGLRRDFNVMETAIDVAHGDLPTAALSRPVGVDPRKRWIQPRIAFPDSFRATVTPRIVLFPERTSERESRLEPLAQVETMMRLLSHSPWARFDPWRGKDQIRVLETLARQAKTYVLHAGEDLVRIPQRASDLLAPLAGGSGA